jgi:hypothetical protein
MASNRIDVATASMLMSVILLNERSRNVDERERYLRDGESPQAFIRRR